MKNVVILPTYNEKENITPLVHAIFKAVPEIYIMVADDNSPDGTAQAVKDLQDTYPHLSLLERKGKEGLGKAYIHAFDEAMKDPEVEKVIMMDADFSHNPETLPALLEANKSANVSIGSRYIQGGKTTGWELWRRILSYGGNLYCRAITHLPVKDCTTGFNVIQVRFLKKVDFSKFNISGYAFIMELKYALWKSGATFNEVPIVFANRTEGASKMSNHIIYEGVLAPWKMVFSKHYRSLS